MIKKQFQKELLLSGTQAKGKTNNRQDVLKVQSWLNLFARQNPKAGTATAIDGDFGPATELAVKNFQKAKKLPETGKVDSALFSVMCEPLSKAFQSPLSGTQLRELVIKAANLHLANQAYELTIKGQANSGPWVRSYMDGHEGTEWFWCMGFVQTIIDQAASAQGKDFRNLMPLTYSCDTVGISGLQKGWVSRYSKIRNNPSLVKPGDIFLLQKTSNDWFHTGIVVAMHQDVMETIEGNTNEAGSHNGVGVFRRTRNFRAQRLDVMSIEALV
jgi:peptidoglycan hydrolase-like protein with peptidoglycan-binding domain